MDRTLATHKIPPSASYSTSRLYAEVASARRKEHITNGEVWDHGMRFVKVASFPNRVEAGIAAGVLELNGIAHIVRGDDVGIFGPGHVGPSVLGIELLVREADLPRARQLLRDAELIN